MKVIIIGASGQVGYALYQLLLKMNWQIVLVSRAELPYSIYDEGVKHYRIDRYDLISFGKLLAEGADWIIDLIAFTPQDIETVLAYQHCFNHLTVLSSSSVYSDSKGRTLDEAGSTGFPLFDKPISEQQQTVGASNATYSTQKIALEHALIQKAVIPYTILRPCAIYGKYSHHSREWWVVKRILDKRPFIPITYNGESLFHTTSANLIATISLAAMESHQNNIINVGDRNPLSVSNIIQCIAQYLGYSGEIIPINFEKDSYPQVGLSPWSVPKPFLLDTGLSEHVLSVNGDVLTEYKDQIRNYIDQLAHIENSKDWKIRFPQLAAYPYEQFDYPLEDKMMGFK